MGTTYTASTHTLKAGDLLALPDPAEGGHYELSDGELVTVPGANLGHEEVKARIHELLVFWNGRPGYGRVYGESMFQLAENTARQPDVAFVSNQRRLEQQDRSKLARFIPEVVVEVISDSEKVWNARKKVREYLQAGVVEVWQVYPESKTVEVRTSSGVRELEGDQVIQSVALPGFSAKVSEFFD